jgi:hypothetical protein
MSLASVSPTEHLVGLRIVGDGLGLGIKVQLFTGSDSDIR